MPVLAPKIKGTEKLTPLQNYMMDILTVGPNLAGLPHISVPAGFADELPVGVMFIGDHLMEKKIIQLASWVKPR
jgi:aspartyl-tRNA(Asn)/glutamyl-tRNA(Gln) amidotransferase subunit A